MSTKDMKDKEFFELSNERMYDGDAVPSRKALPLAWSRHATTHLDLLPTDKLERLGDGTRVNARPFGYISTAIFVAAHIGQFCAADVEKAATVLRAQHMGQAAERCDRALARFNTRQGAKL